MNDVTVIGRERCQGFCDNIDETVLLLKSGKKGGSGEGIIKKL